MAHHEDSTTNIVSGILLGALIGVLLGFGIDYFLAEPLLFKGDIIALIATICGILGYFFGSGFIEWLQENVWWFW